VQILPKAALLGAGVKNKQLIIGGFGYIQFNNVCALTQCNFKSLPGVPRNIAAVRAHMGGNADAVKLIHNDPFRPAENCA
jgi:hypothetical protein